MPDLEMLLREVRPVPDPAWTAKLDARVFHHDSGHLTPLPLEGRKLVADPSWVDR